MHKVVDVVGLIAGLLVGAILLFVLDGGLRAQPQQPAQTVRFAADDRQVGQLLLQLQTLNANLTTTVATRGLVVRGGWTRPIGQVGDALKVWPAVPTDPCSGIDKGNIAISQTASTKLVPGLPGMRIFVCHARVVAGAAEIPSFIEGTGAACATGTAAVSGSTTAANGESYAANGGFDSGNGGGSVMVTNKAGDDLCLAQSGANRLAGNLVYAYGKP